MLLNRYWCRVRGPKGVIEIMRFKFYPRRHFSICLHSGASGRIFPVRLVTKVPFFDLKKQFVPLREEILNEIASVCDAQAFILGAKVEKFEQAIAKLCGGRHAIGVSSGTDAELLILMALGIGPGDAVVTTPFTFFATAGGIARVGARVIFADIERESFNICPERLRECLERHQGERIKAIMPVHLFG